MPNTPALVGEGMSALCRNENVEEKRQQERSEYSSALFAHVAFHQPTKPFNKHFKHALCAARNELSTASNTAENHNADNARKPAHVECLHVHCSTQKIDMLRQVVNDFIACLFSISHVCSPFLTIRQRLFFWIREIL